MLLAPVVLSAVSQPPNFPPVWSGIPTANYTMVGYDAGTLNVAFSSDCSAGPGSQKISTVYPDRYTVITRCDQGVSYVIDPSSRGGGCVLWPIMGDTCKYCACPFCVRDFRGGWGSAGPGEITWSSEGAPSTSSLRRDSGGVRP